MIARDTSAVGSLFFQTGNIENLNQRLTTVYQTPPKTMTKKMSIYDEFHKYKIGGGTNNFNVNETEETNSLTEEKELIR